MDLEKFMSEVTELKNERELLAKRVIELEQENKQIKGESLELAKALDANSKETEKVKDEVAILTDKIKIAIDLLQNGAPNKKEKAK
jgi:septal ring factor EnvC (AmiA/AmiB activator)